MPAIATMVMILNLRFLGSPMGFLAAFLVNVFYVGLALTYYFGRPTPAMFDDDYGPLLMPGFAVIAASSLAGVMLAGAIVLYEDTRILWTDDDPPKDKEDLPEEVPLPKDVKGRIFPFRRSA